MANRAKAKAQDAPTNDMSYLTEAPEDWQFETVAEESATTVIFDEPGDIFIGQYVGVEHIDPGNGRDEPFDRFTFRGRDGELYAINQNYKLIRAMETVGSDQWVRITYVKDVKTNRPEPMKDFRVEVKK